MISSLIIMVDFSVEVASYTVRTWAESMFDLCTYTVRIRAVKGLNMFHIDVDRMLSVFLCAHLCLLYDELPNYVPMGLPFGLN